MTLVVDLCSQEDSALFTNPLQRSSEEEDGPEGMQHVWGPNSAPGWIQGLHLVPGPCQGTV